MNDGRQTPHSSSFPWESRGGWREVGLLINPSAERGRERVGAVRKWRCRRLGLAKGSPSRNTHTHTHMHRGRITLIYLARQQLASVCSALTPVQPKSYWGFSSMSLCCFRVLVGAQTAAVTLCVLAWISIFICFAWVKTPEICVWVCVCACLKFAISQTHFCHRQTNWELTLLATQAAQLQVTQWVLQKDDGGKPGWDLLLTVRLKLCVRSARSAQLCTDKCRDLKSTTQAQSVSSG